MAKEWAESFYNSKRWKRCRNSYIKSRIAVDGGMCEICRKDLGYIVHHTILLTPDNINDAEVALNHSRLQYVCKPCHDKQDGHLRPGYAEENERTYAFTADGDVVGYSPLSKD